jgi:hypothetical protein
MLRSIRVAPCPRHELERIWLEKVRQAQKQYAAALRQFKDVCGEELDVHLTSDPTLAIQKARQADMQALEEYMRVLKIFTDLVLRGKIPPE